MLDSFINDLTHIRGIIDKDSEPDFFGRDFSFFSLDPILFYNTKKNVIVYANGLFTDDFNFTAADLSAWNYSIYPLFYKDDQEPFKTLMRALTGANDYSPVPESVYRLVGKYNKYSYYRVRVNKLYKDYYYIQLQNAEKSAIPVLKNNTADQLMQDAESILKFGFSMWDIPNKKVYWTKGMYQLLEYDVEPGDLQLTPELYKSHILKNEAYTLFEKGLDEGSIRTSYTIKYQLKTNRNSILTVSEHTRIEYDEAGKIKMLFGIITDITIQEESMKALADYKSMMLENESFLNYGTWESDAEGQNVYWSEGMYNIFGYDDVDKSKVSVIRELYNKHVDPEGFVPGRTINIPSINERTHYHWDYQIRDNRGALRILSTYAKVIKSGEKELKKIIGTTRDVTELREHERMLEVKILELNRSNKELEEFAYVASHDLQEPLRKISTFSQRLQLKFGNKLGEDGNLYIARMIAACENMRKLIDNLLEFSRINLNNAAPDTVDLQLIVKQALGELDLVIAETGTSVITGTLPIIEAISSQILQLFSNIIGNSIKFRREGIPLEIIIDSRELNLVEKKEFNLDPSHTFFVITVKDNGVGFEQQYATKIFQLFQRLQGKSEYPGTGIGLSICKKIAVNHKGLIYANSAPGDGAVFSIILPQQQ